MTIQGKENKKKQGNTTESGGTESLVFHREVSVAENSDVGVIIVIILREGKKTWNRDSFVCFTDNG